MSLQYFLSFDNNNKNMQKDRVILWLLDIFFIVFENKDNKNSQNYRGKTPAAIVKSAGKNVWFVLKLPQILKVIQV